MNSPAPSSLDLVRNKILNLQAALLEKHPRMPSLLEEIHKTLKAQPENVTLLPEEDIQILVSGLQQHTNTFLAESITKSKGKAGTTARLKNLSEDDI
jgi:hypothetical protein